MLAIAAGGISAIAFPVSVLPSAFAGGRTHASASEAHAGDLSAPRHPRYADLGGAAPVSRRLGWPAVAGSTGTCRPTSGAGGYVNPLAGTHVVSERIDQGVDYAGSGTLAAIGTATVTYVATTGTGWPGAFIEYRLRDGLDAGCYVYYAEGVAPATGLHVGETVTAGQSVASIIPHWEAGIELGWGAGTSTVTYAAKTHQWSARSDEDSVASAAGKNFSALIASLGGAPGRVEG